MTGPQNTSWRQLDPGLKTGDRQSLDETTPPMATCLCLFFPSDRTSADSRFATSIGATRRGTGQRPEQARPTWPRQTQPGLRPCALRLKARDPPRRRTVKFRAFASLPPTIFLQGHLPQLCRSSGRLIRWHFDRPPPQELRLDASAGPPEGLDLPG